MQLHGKVAVVTGAASGIGRAMARRFAIEGAAAVVCLDRQEAALRAVAEEVGGLAIACDVSNEEAIREAVTRTESRHGRIDVFCSNAGIARFGDEHTANEDWQRNWDVHVMAHVYAARAVIPGMVERASGYLVNTSSAAGLLTHIHSATYAVTKHAAIAFAEFLAIRYGDKGVRVSVLCPQAVRTAMTAGHEAGVASVDGMIEAEDVAECVVAAMDREEFLILPHPVVRDYLQRKTADHDRWLGGMRRLARHYEGAD